MNKITLKLLIIQMMFLSILTVNATDIKYEMNPDGSFKALYAVYPSGNVKIKMSMNPDGTYKAIYIQPIGNVYTDLIQALSDEDAKIRYNPETDKWQWTIDGTNWVDFSEGGASDEKVKADINDPEAGYLSEKVQNSINVDTSSHKLQLAGDAENIGNNKYYGTDNTGNRGFFSLSETLGINELNDVVITSPSNGQKLVYNSTEGKWLNTDIIEYSAINITLSDTTALETGVVANVVIPYNCIIKEIELLADTTGSVSVDIWKDTYANYPPTIDDSILPETHPAIENDVKYQDTTLEEWNTSISAGDILTFYIESVADIRQLTIYLKLEKTQ